MTNETTADTTASGAGEGGVVAVACVIRGALANAGCGQEVFLYTPEDFHPEDDELIYDQSAIDTLRAQLESEKCANEQVSKWAAEVVEMNEAQESELVNLRSANIAYSQRVSELTGRAGNYEARAEAAEAEAARLRSVVDGSLAHLYRGSCPDKLEGADSRDAECPACIAIDAARKAATP